MKGDAEYEALSTREFTNATEVPDSGHAGIRTIAWRCSHGECMRTIEDAGKVAALSAVVNAWSR